MIKACTFVLFSISYSQLNNNLSKLRTIMQSYHSLSAQVYQIDKPIGCSFGDVEYYQERLKGVDGRILEPQSVQDGSLFLYYYLVLMLKDLIFPMICCIFVPKI